MKLRRLLSVLCLLPVFACYANDSAYQALRALGSQRGEAILNHVIEVNGRDGNPKPAVWKILLDDPVARGGVRELEMSNGHVISEHTPIRQYTGAGPSVVMDFQRLNLDSPGAFTVANQEAVRLGVGFEKVDYTLRTSDSTGLPVWVLRLMDANSRVMQTVRVSADKGLILHGETAATVTQPAVVQGEIPPPPPPDSVPPPPPQPDSDDSDNPNHQGVGHKIDKAIHHVGADLEQFFTGHRNFERKFQDDQ